MKNVGIYKITNLKNNKIYVGSSLNLEKRYYKHLNSLRRNKHFNIHLQRSFNINGEESFEFSIIEECDDKILVEREEYYIEHLGALIDKNGYNINPKGDRPPSWLGKHHKEESKLKIGLKSKGRIPTQHSKDVASLTHKGKTIPQKQIDNLKIKNSGEGNPMFGRTPYDIWIEKYGKEEADIRLNNMNEKKSEKMLGERNPMFGRTPYDVWFEKYGKEEADIRYGKWKNRIITDETRERMKLSNSGRITSEETKKLFSKQRKGDLNPSCKIKDIEIPKILEMINSGISIKDISKIYNVCTVTIRNIKKGKRKI